MKTTERILCEVLIPSCSQQKTTRCTSCGKEVWNEEAIIYRGQVHCFRCWFPAWKDPRYARYRKAP